MGNEQPVRMRISSLAQDIIHYDNLNVMAWQSPLVEVSHDEAIMRERRETREAWQVISIYIKFWIPTPFVF